MKLLIGLVLGALGRTVDPTTLEERQHPRANQKFHGAPPDARPTSRRRESLVSPAALITAPGGENGDHFGDSVTCASDGWPMLVGARGHEDDEGAVYIYSGPDDAAPVVVQPPDSPVDHVEFGYSVAYASGKFVVGAREIGDNKIGAAFLYSL